MRLDLDLDPDQEKLLPPWLIKARDRANEQRQFVAAREAEAAAWCDENGVKEQDARDAVMSKARHDARLNFARAEQAEKDRQAKTVSLDDVDEPASPDTTTTMEAMESFLALVTKLPEPERSIICQLFLAKEKRASVAEAMGMTTNAVDHARRRAMKLLKDLLTAQE